jgi:hypothetical protein
VRIWPAVRARLAAVAPSLSLALAGPVLTQQTNYQETIPIVYAILIISVIGAAITFGVLIYAVIHFRDPNTVGRRYG